VQFGRKIHGPEGIDAKEPERNPGVLCQTAWEKRGAREVSTIRRPLAVREGAWSDFVRQFR